MNIMTPAPQTVRNRGVSRPHRRHWRSALLMAALVAGGTTAADAAVLGGSKAADSPTGNVYATGGVVVIAPPAAAGNDNQEAEDLFVWNEQQDVRLASDLVIDLGGTSIAAGTWISSHGIVLDTVRPKIMAGTITFDGLILGVVFRTDNLVSSDFLGVAPTVYANVTGRGLEPLARDTTSFAGNVLTFDWISGTPGDNIRVITAGAPRGTGATIAVPEPATWAFMIAGFGLVGAMTRRRRRAVSFG